MTINARNDVDYTPGIVDDDLPEDDASEVDVFYGKQNLADEEEHYATMTRNTQSSYM